MAEIRAFQAIRYQTRSTRDIAARIAPPYDVIDPAGKAALIARDARNFVAIDLPHVPAKEAGPPAVYQNADATLRAWIADGTLARDATPAIYAYHQQYEYAGRTYLRRKFFARLRLEEFGKGSVFPHEQTFGGPKEDRLRLTQATRCNLSPIFGVFEDPTGAVTTRLDAAIAGKEPDAFGVADGVDNRLWAVSEASAIADIQRHMSGKAVFIADGHHRYGTSLNYRAWLAEQGGPLPADHPANFVLCVFCAMEDPGLLILPTHRVLPRVCVSPEALRADGRLSVTPLRAAEPAEVPAALGSHGPQAVGLWSSGHAGYVAITPRDPDILRDFARERSEAWRRLGLSFLHAYLLDRVVAPSAGGAPEIHYVKSAADAVAEARDAGGSVFLLQSTTMAEMRDVCKAGDLMPQKSTYFFPKLASGMVINPLE